MSLDQLKHLLKELGQSIGLPDLAPDDDGYCCLSFDSKITLHIQLDDDTGNLTFFSEVGKVEEDRQLEIYTRMLEANVFWLGTGGATLGVNSENLTATLGYQEPITGIDFQRFQQLLEGFVNTAEKWIDRLIEIQSAPPEDKGGDAAMPPMGDMGMGIRI